MRRKILHIPVLIVFMCCIYAGLSFAGAVEKPENNSLSGNAFKESDGTSTENNEDRLACRVTPSVEYKPDNKKPIKKSNNLIRKAGSPEKAEGHFIQIIGRVVDENCLPMQGAVVEIWQADKLGNYEWEYDTDNYWEVPLEGKDKNFLFSGTALTDNLGQFDFMTIFPGAKEGSAPHINVIVKRSGYKGLQTRMYFSNHPANGNDPVLTNIDSKTKDFLIAKGKNIRQYEGRIYYFPITIEGISPYKRF